VVRLHDHGAALRPVALEGRDHLLVVHAAKTMSYGGSRSMSL
jgi:hypothetical protein